MSDMNVLGPNPQPLKPEQRPRNAGTTSGPASSISTDAIELVAVLGYN
jgi:hypothetical protein